MFDALIGHVIDELAMSGDDGVSPHILTDLITDFYSSHASPQNVDQAFVQFVWSQLTQLPNIQVGSLEDAPEPGSVVSEEEVAQPKGKRKSKTAAKASKLGDGRKPGKSKVFVAAQEPNEAGSSNWKSMDALVARFGNKLRLAVDKETAWVSLTGSHARPSKLTPYVYAILQSIAGGRGAGVTVVDLGNEFSHDQKSIFHFVKSLLELNLIVKFRTVDKKQTTSRCIHRRYLDKSPAWSAHIATDVSAAVEAAGNDSDDDTATMLKPHEFSPINMMHLHSNEPLIRSRIISALKKRPEQRMVHSDVIHAINVTTISISVRRKLNSIILAMENEGILARVGLPSGRKTGSHVYSVALVAPPEDEEKEDEEMVEGQADESEKDEPTSSVTHLWSTMTVQRQILDLLFSAGEVGLIMREMTDALASVETRTLEAMLGSLERIPLPPHLSDYTIVSVLETFGRQKRARFFGLQGYHNRCQIDGVPTPGDQLAKVDEEAAGGFSPIETTGTYANIQELNDWGRDTVREVNNAKTGKPQGTGKRGRPRKDAAAPSAPTSKAKGKAKAIIADDAPTEDQPAKPKTVKKKVKEPPAEPAVPKKRGRPKKDPNAPISAYRRKQKADGTLLNPRAHEPKDVPIDQLPPPKWKGKKRRSSVGPDAEPATKRPKRNAAECEASPSGADTSEAPTNATDALMADEGAGFAIEISPPPTLEPNAEKPLRVIATPRKDVPKTSTPAEPATASASAAQATAEGSSSAPPKRKRGRPRKDAIASVDKAGQDESPAVAPQENDGSAQIEEEDTGPVPPKRKRGRPPKYPQKAAAKAAALSASKIPVSPALFSAPGSFSPMAAPASSSASRTFGTASGTSENNIRKEPSVAPQAESSSVQNKKARFIDYPLPQHEEEARSQATAETSTAMQQSIDQDLPPPESFTADPAPSSQPPATGSTEDAGLSARMKRQQKMKAPLVSQTRKSHSGALREKEVLEALEESGGILEEGMDMRRAHYKVFSRSENAAGTTVVDRRTLDMATNALERAGAVKRVTVSAANALGVMKPRKLVHLNRIDMKSEVMKKYIAGLSETTQSFRVGRKPNYGTNIYTAPPPEVVKAIHPRKTPAKYGRSLGPNEELEGDKVQMHLAADWRTVAQTYGFITGKMARARILHLALLRLANAGQSPRILNKSTPNLDNEPIIVESSIVSRDLTLGDMLKLTPITVFDDELDQLLESPNSREIVMDDLPKNLSRVVGAGHPKSKTRLHALINILVNLRLVIPLEYSQDPTEISRQSEAGPMYYRPADNIKEAAIWILARQAPLYSIGSPIQKLIKVVPVNTVAVAQLYWTELEDYCFPNLPNRTSLPVPPLTDDQVQEYDSIWTGPSSMYKDFTDTRRWVSDYNLGNLQRRYLKSVAKDQQSIFTDEEMQRLSSVTFASKDVIMSFFAKWKWSRKKLGQKPKSKKSAKPTEESQMIGAASATQIDNSDSASEDGTVRTPKATGAEVAKILARKGNADAGRSAEWDSLVQQFSEDLNYAIQPGAQLDRIKSMFMRPLGTSAHDFKAHFETLVKNQKRVEEVQAMVAKANAGNAGPTQPFSNTSSNNATMLPQDSFQVSQADINLAKKSAAEIIQYARDQSMAKGKRMKWTDTTDDLLRDYWVVMRSRCILLDVANYWKGAEALFPSSTARSLQNHFEILSGKAGEDRYLAELLQMWTSVWVANRGSPLLPEARPDAPGGFDVGHFIVHLRRSVDKPTARLRAYVEAPENIVHNLPANVAQIETEFSLRKPVSWREQDRWQYMWSSAAQNNRQMQANYNSLSYAATDVESDSVIALELAAARESMRACSAIKSLVATPEHLYNSEAGVQMLGIFQENYLTDALDEMQQMGIITKVQSEQNRRVPGRNYVFASKWKQAFESGLAKDTMQAASTLDSLLQFEAGKNLDWPLIPEDGEMLVLFERFSHDELDLSIDVSRTADKRDPSKNEDYVTRKLDDEDIENDVSILARDPQISRDFGGGPVTERDEMPGAGYLNSKKSWLASLAYPLQELAGQLLVLVENGGDAGITASFLSAYFDGRNVELSQCLLNLPTTAPLFWAGYDTPRLVSSLYFSSWAVALVDKDHGKRLMLPRTWIDVYGNLNASMWQRLCSKVVTLLYLSPGSTEIHLLNLVQPLLLLPELLDILAHLHQCGILKRQIVVEAAEADYLFWQENAWFVDDTGCLLNDA